MQRTGQALTEAELKCVLQERHLNPDLSSKGRTLNGSLARGWGGG